MAISSGNSRQDWTATDMGTKLMEVCSKLEREHKEKLEVDHCVCINRDVMDLVCEVVGRCFPGGSESGNSTEVVLQGKAFKLLQEACLRARHKVDTNEEENRMDQFEYLLYRALVELEETKKEKEHASRLWIPRVEKEYNGLLDMWDTLIRKWSHALKSCGKSSSRAQKINKVLDIRAGLINCMRKEVEPEFKTEFMYDWFKKLGTIMNELLQLTHESFKKHITVTPSIVAEVASPMTGVPASWLRNSWKPPLQELRNGLLKILSVQTHAITIITNALSRQRLNGNDSCPIGSFLLLLDGDFCRLELAEALAEQLYDDKGFVMSFDISDDKNLHIIGDEGRVGGNLIEGVKNMPFSVLLFENFDEANKCSIEVLLHIIEGGRLIDSQGNTIDFSKTLVMVNSDFGKKNRRDPFYVCKCLEDDQDLPIKTVVFRPNWESSHKCMYLPVLREARLHFEDKLYNDVDDIIIFDSYECVTRNVLARSQLRDIPKKIKQENLILYPSEAALRSITMGSRYREAVFFESISKGSLHGKAIEMDTREHVRAWLEENMAHVLSGIIVDNDINDISLIYIDALVGTDEMSYRLKRGGSEEDIYFWQLKNSLTEARTIYKDQKTQIGYICSLRKHCFKLINMMDRKAAIDTDMVQEICSLLDFFIANALAVRSKCKEDYKMVPLKSLNKEELRQSNMTIKSSLVEVSENTGGRTNQAIDIFRESLLKFVSNEPRKNMLRQPVMSFLFLGLSRVGKADLAKCLAESFGTEAVININLQEYGEPKSLLFQLADQISEPLLMSNNGVVIPFRVLLIDEVEKAHMPVFGALIDLLDHGILRDGQGRIFDVSNTIVVIMSHLGNNKMLAKLVRTAPGAVVSDVGNEGGKRFRTELLNRIDEIVMVNPFTQDQLNKVARLPMKCGRHLQDGTPSSIPFCFDRLFSDSNDPLLQTFPGCQREAAQHLKLGLLKRRKAHDMVVR